MVSYNDDKKKDTREDGEQSWKHILRASTAKDYMAAGPEGGSRTEFGRNRGQKAPCIRHPGIPGHTSRKSELNWHRS